MDCDPSTWRSRMTTARRRMNNPDAKWQILTYDDHYIIMRLPDGVKPSRDPRGNKYARFLADMALGETKFGGELFKDTHDLVLSRKILARKLLGQPHANWKSWSIPGGVNIKRIR